ncbi:MAG: M28 family peptidase [Deltaproteobacteria bacterium]
MSATITRFVGCLCGLLLLVAAGAGAQEITRSTPPVPSNAEMFGWAREVVALSEKHKEFRRMGTPGDEEVRGFIAGQLRSFGFRQVEQQAFRFERRDYHSWEFAVEGEDVPAFFLRGASFTGGAGLAGELLFVGDTIDPALDLRGRIVVFEVRGQAIPGALAPAIADFIYDPNETLAQTSFGGKAGPIPRNFPVSYYTAAARGAVGFVAILKDYDTGTDRFYPDPSAMVQARIPGVFVGKYEGEKLVARLRAATAPLQGRIKVEGRVVAASSANIVGVLKGEKPETILINTHHDAGWAGGVQDASGIAAVLGLAKYFSQVPSNFRQKTLVFVFDGNHYDWNYPRGANEFAAANPRVMANTVLAIGIEHIAKRFEATAEGYVDTGGVEPRILFTPPNHLLFEATKAAIEAGDLHDTLIPRSGTIAMFGETQSYFLQGIPSYSLISGPEYLFLADDTIDKIADEEFEAVIRTFIAIIDKAMYLPRSWIERIDR